MALEVFDNKRTDWLGLWYHKESLSYSSQAINLSALRKFKGNIRLYVKKNKYYEKDSGRPNYVFIIADANGERFTEPSVVDDDYGYWVNGSENNGLLADGVDLDDEYVSLEDAVKIAQGLVDDCVFGYSQDDLCVEARSFMAEKSVTVGELLGIDS